MKIPLSIVVALMALSARASAQRILTPDWFRVSATESIYTNMDSIAKIGPETYRVVLINDTFPGLRDILTEEVRCADHTARTIRVRSVGKHYAGQTEDRSEPNAPFVKYNPGSAAESKYQKVCSKAQRKFAAK
jgi:hypothetical protein